MKMGKSSVIWILFLLAISFMFAAPYITTADISETDGTLKGGADDTNTIDAIDEPVPYCGNYVRDGDEMCDDGNTQDGDYCPATCGDPPEHLCIIPDTLGDTIQEHVKVGYDPAVDILQPVLDRYGLNASADQKQYQIWNFTGTDDLIIEVRHIGDSTFAPADIDPATFSVYANVFGYYVDGDASEFVPIFKKIGDGGLDHPNFPSVPILSPNQSMNVTITAGSNITFAISTYTGETTHLYSTFNGSNPDKKDHAVVYDPHSALYLIGFEDIFDLGDSDYEDLVVQIKILSCSQAVCGDGDIDEGEQCDDGTNNGLACTPPYSGLCSYCSDVCSIVNLTGHFCGDGVTDSNEECDDGNDINGDGCSSLCVLENGAISGIKFEDDNGNGVMNTGEIGLANWTINLYRSTANQTLNISAVTDSNGRYTFNGLTAGNYTLTENLKNGWIPTTPVIYVYLNPGANSTGKNFGNFRPGRISGNKFNDTNGNGVEDDGEPPLANWTIVLIYPNGTTVQQITDNDGHYIFRNLTAGNYTVNEILQDGWTKTRPGGDGMYHILIKSGSQFTQKDFGNFMQLPVCGDDITNDGEQCDDGIGNGVACVPPYDGLCSYCSSTCNTVNLTGPFCGDDVKNGPEECDGTDGVGLNQACTESCQLVDLPYCGDGIENGGEECDDGNLNNGDACTNSCTKTFCGDETIQSPNGFGQSEACDDGNTDGGDGCSSTCQIEQCGNNVVDIGEQCDSGIINGLTCVPPYDGSCLYCSGMCSIVNLTGPFCGDDIRNGIEQCDGTDGVGQHQTCDGTCRIINLPYCGDTIVDDGEQCDDGNTQDGDGCSAVCEIEVCEPLTQKTYGQPFFTNLTSEWINLTTNITLSAIADVCAANLTTYYRVNLVDDEYCFNTAACQNLTGSGSWNTYTGPFKINETSCHLIEFFTSAENNETVKKQCAFVDNSAPVANKTVGDPKQMWSGADANFYNLTDKCWASNNSIDCWRVTLDTPIKLSCDDPQPHPVDESTACFFVELDGDDATQSYCNTLGGSYNITGNNYCCMAEGVTFNFQEESEHNLKFYCQDKLGNQGHLDDEKFKVEGNAFNIILNKKWNLVSVPFALKNNSIDGLFGVSDDIDSVWTYDAVNGVWLAFIPDGIYNDDLTTIVPGTGYWVLAKKNTTLLVGGSLFDPATTPPSKQLVAGWNMIGYYGNLAANGTQLPVYNGPFGNGKNTTCALGTLVDTSFGNPKWSSLWAYWEPLNPNQWIPLDFTSSMDPGAGYWMEIDVNESYAPSMTC